VSSWHTVVVPCEQRIGDGDILISHAQEKGIWMEMLVRLEP
jgi:hypothetical protein